MEKDWSNECAQDPLLVAYMANKWNALTGNVWGMMKICDRSFDQNWIAQRLPRGSGRGRAHTNQVCEIFRTSDGALRLGHKMHNLPAVLLHEITHFNLVGLPARRDFETHPFEVTRSPYIVDYAPGPLLAYRCWDLGGGENCALNAYSYEWFATEVFWTYECFSYLEAHQSVNVADVTCPWRFGPPNGESVGGWDYENPDNTEAPRPPLRHDPDGPTDFLPTRPGQPSDPLPE